MSIKKMIKVSKVAAATAASLLAVNTFAMIDSGWGSSSPTKLIIGDSIFALSGDIHEFLEDSLDETIRTEARSGCQMNGGSIICSSRYTIPNQFERANKRGIETVIMNGGGNDFLLGDGAGCGAATSSACQEVLMAVEETIDGLFSDIQSEGITEIVYLGYFATTASSGNNDLNDYSMNYKAANYPMKGVKFVDTRASFAGNESSYIISDGIHPSAAGSRVLANLILEALD